MAQGGNGLQGLQQARPDSFNAKAAGEADGGGAQVRSGTPSGVAADAFQEFGTGEAPQVPEWDRAPEAV